MEQRGWVHKIIHNTIVHREYTECRCNIPADGATLLCSSQGKSCCGGFGVSSSDLFQPRKEAFGRQRCSLLCTCRRGTHRAGCHVWGIKQVVCLVRCCKKLWGFHVVVTLSVLSLFLPFLRAAGSASIPGVLAWDNQPTWSKAVRQKNWSRNNPPPYPEHSLQVSTRLLVQKTKSHENLIPKLARAGWSHWTKPTVQLLLS